MTHSQLLLEMSKVAQCGISFSDDHKIQPRSLWVNKTSVWVYVNITWCIARGLAHVSWKISLTAAEALAVVDQFFQSKCRHGSSQVSLTPPLLVMRTLDLINKKTESKTKTMSKCRHGSSQVSLSLSPTPLWLDLQSFRHLQNYWLEWWGNMAWPTKRQRQSQRQCHGSSLVCVSLVFCPKAQKLPQSSAGVGLFSINNFVLILI